MTPRRNVAGWPVVMIGVGITGAAVLWRDVVREGTLALGATPVRAAVEVVRADLATPGTDSSAIPFAVDYRFLTAGGVVHGTFSCPCREVEALQGQDSITVLVARRSSAVHRPAGVPVRPLAVTLPIFALSLAGIVAGAAGVVRRLLQAAGPPPPPRDGNGFTPLSVPHRHRP